MKSQPWGLESREGNGFQREEEAGEAEGFSVVERRAGPVARVERARAWAETREEK